MSKLTMRPSGGRASRQTGSWRPCGTDGGHSILKYKMLVCMDSVRQAASREVGMRGGYAERLVNARLSSRIDPKVSEKLKFESELLHYYCSLMFPSSKNFRDRHSVKTLE